MDCKHENFIADVQVNRIEESEGGPIVRFNADVRIICSDCNTKFKFIGLPVGLDMDGASVSIDGTEARLCVAPANEVMTPLEGVTGFTARRVK